MHFRIHHPAPPLSGFVEMFWASEGYAVGHALERVLPTGTVELVINLRQNETRTYDLHNLNRYTKCSGAILTGVHSKPFVIDTEEQFSVIGVHFKPGGAFPFFRAPAGEFHNVSLSGEEVFGRTISLLRERLLEATDLKQRFWILEKYLLSEAAKPLTRHRAVEFALRAFQGEAVRDNVSEVIERTGYSQRRFIELFQAEVGITPKLYRRIQRFQNILRNIHSQSKVKWLDTALDTGFFDQAHFIRDFQAFSGMSPTAYLNQRTQHLNHVPIV